MSYDDLKVIEGAQLLKSIAFSAPVGASVEDAVQAAIALQAMVESASTGRWVVLPTASEPATGASPNRTGVTERTPGDETAGTPTELS
jgi:hypothetical protein